MNKDYRLAFMQITAFVRAYHIRVISVLACRFISYIFAGAAVVQACVCIQDVSTACNVCHRQEDVLVPYMNMLYLPANTSACVTFRLCVMVWDHAAKVAYLALFQITIPVCIRKSLSYTAFCVGANRLQSQDAQNAVSLGGVDARATQLKPDPLKTTAYVVPVTNPPAVMLAPASFCSG